MIHRKKRKFLSFSITTWIIIINVVLFFAFHIANIFINGFFNKIALHPIDFLQGKGIWTILTSMFTHQMGFHLFVNMFSLYFLGNLSERIIGRKRYIWLYLLSGIGGSLAFVFLADLGTAFFRGDYVFGSIEDCAVGASGAIFGLLGLLAVLIPRSKVYLVLGPLIVIILQFTIGAFLKGNVATVFNAVMTIIVFAMIFTMFSPNPKTRRISLPVGMSLWVAPIAAIVPLVIVSFLVKLPIANTAHFGGLIVGLLFGFYLRRKYKKKVVLLQRYFTR